MNIGSIFNSGSQGTFFVKRNDLFAKGNGPNEKRNDLNEKKR